MKIKQDSHVHTPFCPHGSSDEMELYVQKAIQLGLEEITFTEHAPLPPSFSDPAPTKDSSMDDKNVPAYLAEGSRLREKYANDIRVKLGFEVDYIEGYEEETIQFLDKWGEKIDDAILSVHFLPVDSEFICMDYSANEFGRLVDKLGSVEEVHELYYRMVQQSIHANLGNYKPNRIGHVTLVKKFQKKYPVNKDFSVPISRLLDLIKKEGFQLDANTAGWFKPDCEESYPPTPVLEQAIAKGIPVIPGSDSHQASHLARGFEDLNL